MARTDIHRYRGDTKDIVMKLTQNNDVFDLNGFSSILSVSATESPTTADYEFQSTATINTVDGSLTFPISADQADLVGTYYYDVELTDGAGKISTIRKGAMIFTQDIGK